jgi:serine protease Do
VRGFVIAILGLFILIAGPASGPAHADAGDISAASRSVVRVVVYSAANGTREFLGHGSGVVVAPDKIVTNAHVVQDANVDETMTFLIIPSEGSKSYTAKLIDASGGNDLALLQITGGGRLPAASLYTGTLGDGADVFAIGYPANVDIALQQDESDMLRPQSPVKTRGSISSGRSSKSFDSLLHTAPIAPGNSGGPLVDACGRVVGINSFGSTATEGGAEFYFAVSTRELAAFLRKENVPFNAVTGECRSVAELTRAEADREAADRARIDAENRIALDKRNNSAGLTRRDAEFDIITARENRMMLSLTLLILALGATGTGYVLFERETRDRAKIAWISAGALVFVALMIFLTRPSFKEVEERVKAAMTKTEPTPTIKDNVATGKKVCVIQLDRSRVTVSTTADVDFNWTATGCVNGRTQYVEDNGKWVRTLVPGSDEQVSVISYAPDSKTYRVERYLLGLDAMGKARKARNRYEVKGCTSDPLMREKVDNMNKAIREVLPAQPNEMLVFACSDAK